MTFTGLNLTDQLNASLQDAPSQSGYDMIASGDWGGLLYHYGVSSIVTFIIVYFMIHYGRLCLKKHFEEMREEKRQAQISALLPGVYK